MAAIGNRSTFEIMKIKFILILIWGIVVTSTISQAYGCDCVWNKLEQSIKLTDFIISGRFIQGDNLWELSGTNKNAPTLYYTGRFVVTHVLKGNEVKVGDTLEVVSDYTNCSTLYKNDTNYLLFATVDKRNIKTTICSYSGILDEEKTKKYLKQTKRLLKK
jgi:hypothetical protein